MPNPIPDAARAFAQDWIAAWNARDLDAVLAHYSEDCTFASPFVAHFADEPGGRLAGKTSLRAYWAAALAALPALRSELVDVLTDVGCITILYRGRRGLTAEVFELGAGGKVVHGLALYAQAAQS
ncbi:MAG: nuclear transport factor 2 family protein [Thiobacillus sp.]|nr:nuclear transport factor 2 family protein [Thiobacillus sp.]